MDINLIKEVTLEYIENIYALSISYLKNNNNIELKNLLKELELMEDKIRECEDENLLNNYKNILDDLINKIEGIINE